jgi:hypothetical protein
LIHSANPDVTAFRQVASGRLPKPGHPGVPWWPRAPAPISAGSFRSSTESRPALGLLGASQLCSRRSLPAAGLPPSHAARSRSHTPSEERRSSPQSKGLRLSALPLQDTARGGIRGPPSVIEKHLREGRADSAGVASMESRTLI